MSKFTKAKLKEIIDEYGDYKSTEAKLLVALAKALRAAMDEIDTPVWGFYDL